jgi:hypothetical protein
MSADSCIFCLELLSKATDRNLVDGKGKWGLELVDFPFVVQSLQGWKKYFIFWDRNEKWEHFLRVVDTNPV